MREVSSTSSPDQQLADFIAAQSLPLPQDLVLDGKIQRFGEGEKGREPHWYIGSRNPDDGISLTAGSHKDSELKVTFKSKGPLWRRDADLLEKWESCKTIGSSDYLKHKQIKVLFGARINFFGALVIPMYSEGANLVGLQTIGIDGRKLFVRGTKKKGSYFELQAPNLDHTRIFVAEGFATAASICMATKGRTVCAFDSGNLPHVVQAVRKLHPQAKIIVAGDDDRFGGINAGRKAAERVKDIAFAIFPRFSTSDGQPTDWNDLHVREGLEAVKMQINAALEEASVEAAPMLLDPAPKPPPLPEHDEAVAESAPQEPQARTSGTSVHDIKLPPNDPNFLSETEELIKRAREERAPALFDDVTKAVSGFELEEAEPPADENFVLPGFLMGHVGILCSPGGCGKSGVALLIANQIACGGKNDFLGFGPIVGGAS